MLAFGTSSTALAWQGADDCANAQPISGFGPHAFDNTAATATPGLTDCNGLGVRKDVWFLWTASVDARITFGGSQFNDVVDSHAPTDQYVVEWDAALGTNYCQAVPNSTGQLGLMSVSASLEVANNDLRLEASNLPTFAFSFFITSPMPGFAVLPGDSHSFQAWYRDSSGGQAGSNFTDGYAITFQ